MKTFADLMVLTFVVSSMLGVGLSLTLPQNIALVLTPAMNFQSLLGIVGTGAILAGLLFLIVSFVVGYVLGGPVDDSKTVLGFGTAARNIPAAMIVAGQNFKDPDVAVMIIVVVLLT